MILEYFSFEKGPFIGLWGRLEKFLPFHFRIITSYLKKVEFPDCPFFTNSPIFLMGITRYLSLKR
jgi:hypothetical protein